ncbi:hypothetical protein Tco_1482129 [Tanacetum coccineum]
MGGLGVGSLLSKNLGLLCKWKWRFLTKENGLWQRVISSFYSPDGGFGGLLNDERKHGVWCDILRSLVYIENLDSSFGSMFFKKISSGSNTFFWKDVWCKEDDLSMVLGGLFGIGELILGKEL